MPRVSVGPAEVHYRKEGSGPGLVLVHGTGGSAEANWAHLIDRFARRRTVVAPDYAGSGATTDHWLRLQLDDLVAQVLGAADDADLEQFDLVGFSLGAAVAVSLAGRHPDRVRSLVPIAGWLSSDDARIQLQFRLWQELQSLDTRLYGRFLALTGFSPPFLSAMSWPELEGLAAEIGFTVPPGMARQSELDLRVDVTEEARRITAPTLVIGNTRDHMVPVEHARAMHAAIPGSSYREFNSGHLVIFEAADELADLIDGFLDRDGEPAASRIDRTERAQ